MTVSRSLCYLTVSPQTTKSGPNASARHSKASRGIQHWLPLLSNLCSVHLQADSLRLYVMRKQLRYKADMGPSPRYTRLRLERSLFTHWWTILTGSLLPLLTSSPYSMCTYKIPVRFFIRFLRKVSFLIPYCSWTLRNWIRILAFYFISRFTPRAKLF